MYSLFTAAEFIGRSLGGVVQYRITIPPKKKFGFAFLVYQIYETLDILLLWLPYPLMLVNRALCGFLGLQSATLRQAAVQRYLPEHFRARINAFANMQALVASGVLSVLIGALGEMLDYRLCLSLAAAATLVWCWLTVWRQRTGLRRVYEYEPQPMK